MYRAMSVAAQCQEEWARVVMKTGQLSSCFSVFLLCFVPILLFFLIFLPPAPICLGSCIRTRFKLEADCKQSRETWSEFQRKPLLCVRDLKEISHYTNSFLIYVMLSKRLRGTFHTDRSDRWASILYCECPKDLAPMA